MAKGPDSRGEGDEGTGTPHKGARPSRAPKPPAGSLRVQVLSGLGDPATAAPVSFRGAGWRYRESLPVDSAAARPASSRATGIRNGEQET